MSSGGVRAGWGSSFRAVLGIAPGGCCFLEHGGAQVLLGVEALEDSVRLRRSGAKRR